MAKSSTLQTAFSITIQSTIYQFRENTKDLETRKETCLMKARKKIAEKGWIIIAKSNNNRENRFWRKNLIELTPWTKRLKALKEKNQKCWKRKFNRELSKNLNQMKRKRKLGRSIKPRSSLKSLHIGKKKYKLIVFFVKEMVLETNRRSLTKRSLSK